MIRERFMINVNNSFVLPKIINCREVMDGIHELYIKKDFNIIPSEDKKITENKDTLFVFEFPFQKKHIKHIRNNDGLTYKEFFQHIYDMFFDIVSEYTKCRAGISTLSCDVDDVIINNIYKINEKEFHIDLCQCDDVLYEG